MTKTPLAGEQAVPLVPDHVADRECFDHPTIVKLRTFLSAAIGLDVPLQEARILLQIARKYRHETIARILGWRTWHWQRLRDLQAEAQRLDDFDLDAVEPAPLLVSTVREDLRDCLDGTLPLPDRPWANALLEEHGLTWRDFGDPWDACATESHCKTCGRSALHPDACCFPPARVSFPNERVAHTATQAKPASADSTPQTSATGDVKLASGESTPPVEVKPASAEPTSPTSPRADVTPASAESTSPEVTSGHSESSSRDRPPTELVSVGSTEKPAVESRKAPKARLTLRPIRRDNYRLLIGAMLIGQWKKKQALTTTLIEYIPKQSKPRQTVKRDTIEDIFIEARTADKLPLADAHRSYLLIIRALRDLLEGRRMRTEDTVLSRLAEFGCEFDPKTVREILRLARDSF